jgi:hypothetical protein
MVSVRESAQQYAQDQMFSIDRVTQPNARPGQMRLWLRG